MAQTFSVYLDDEGGSLKRFLRQAPEAMKQELVAAVDRAAQTVETRMRAGAPVGPDAPHIRDDITATKAKIGKLSVSARVGYFGGTGDSSDQPHIALYNEFRPNRQPFMREAGEDSGSTLKSGVEDAINRMARRFEI